MDELSENVVKKNDIHRQLLQLDKVLQDNFLAQHSRGYNILHRLINEEHAACLIERLLQQAHAQQLLSHQEYEHGQTPLHVAANHDDSNLIIILYKSFSIECFNRAAGVRDVFGLTTTHYLIRNQHPFFIDLYRQRLLSRQNSIFSIHNKQFFKNEALMKHFNNNEAVANKAKELVGRLLYAIMHNDPAYFFEVMGYVLQLSITTSTRIFAEINRNQYDKAPLLIALTEALNFETNAWCDALLLLFNNKIVPNIIYPDTQEALLIVIQRRVNYSLYEVMLFALRENIDFYPKPLNSECDAFWQMRFHIDFGCPEINRENSENFFYQHYQQIRDDLHQLNANQKALYAAEHGLYVILARLFPHDHGDLYDCGELDKETVHASLVIALQKRRNEVFKLLMLRLTPAALSHRIGDGNQSKELKQIAEETKNIEIIHFIDRRSMQYEQFRKYYTLNDMLYDFGRSKFPAHMTVINALLELHQSQFAACLKAADLKPLTQFFLLASARAISMDYILFLDLRLNLFKYTAKMLVNEVPEISITLRIIEIFFGERAKVFNVDSLEPHRRDQLSTILRDSMPNDNFEKHIALKIIKLLAGIGNDPEKVMLTADCLLDDLSFLFKNPNHPEVKWIDAEKNIIEELVARFKVIKNDVDKWDTIPQDLWRMVFPLYPDLDRTRHGILPEEMRAYIRIIKQYFDFHEWTDLLVAVNFRLNETVRVILGEPALLTQVELIKALQLALGINNYDAVHQLLRHSEYCQDVLRERPITNLKPFLCKEIKDATTLSDLQLLFDVYYSVYKNIIFPTTSLSFFATPHPVWVDVLTLLKKQLIVIAKVVPSINEAQHDLFKKIIRFDRSYCNENDKIEAEYLSIYHSKAAPVQNKNSEIINIGLNFNPARLLAR